MLQALAVALVALLVIQFWNLQVVRARHFRELAENNRSRLVVVAAPRGALLDRKGQVLVGNRPSFNVVLNTEHLVNLDRLVGRLAETLGVGEAQIMDVLGVGRTAIWRTRRAYLEGGLQLALHDVARPGKPRRYGTDVEAQVSALACSAPPT